MPTPDRTRMDADASSETAPARRLRADAERSIETILDAALAGIQADAELNMSAVARDAGVSRVTLYAHFPTREALVEAVVRRAVATAAALLADADLDQGPADEALARLLRSSWQVLSQYRNLHAVASSVLPPAQLRDSHEPILGPLQRLITRGQAAGSLRRDLPLDWILATILNLLHLAAEQIQAGQLHPEQAGDVATTTILAALTDTPSSPPPKRAGRTRRTTQSTTPNREGTDRPGSR